MARKPPPVSGQFKKGQVANPNGRPTKDRCWADMLRAEGMRPARDSKGSPVVDKYGKELTWMEACVQVAYLQALQGEAWAFNFIADRTDGKPVTPINLNQGEDLLITHRVIKAGVITSESNAEPDNRLAPTAT